MTRFLIRRLLQAVLTFAGVLVIVFFALRLTGDPTLLLAPENASREQIDLLRRQLGFDRPMFVQFVDYLGDLARLDFGTSAVQRLPVSTIVLSRLPYSLALSCAALAFALGAGAVLGLTAVRARSGAMRLLASGAILTGQSLPTFLSATLLIALFAVGLNWLPTSGADSALALIMPAVALGAYSAAVIARMVRSSLCEELSKDYIRACRARGLDDSRIIRHALRNAAPPLMALAALEAGNLFAGTVIVETVFAWPGIGQLALQSVQSRDFLVAQSVVLVVTFAYLSASLVADALHAAFDPRLRGEPA